MSSTSVLVIEDHLFIRMGICYLLEKAPDIKVVGEANSEKDIFKLIQDLLPDVVVLDMELPGLDPIRMIKHIRRLHLPIHILVLSAHTDKHDIIQLLSIGVDDYLVKDEALDVVVEAVRRFGQQDQGWADKLRRLRRPMRKEPNKQRRLSCKEFRQLEPLVLRTSFYQSQYPYSTKKYLGKDVIRQNCLN